MLDYMETEFYRFDPIRNRNGQVSPFQRRFEDEKDFAVNPRLLEQLALDTCPETTPEGKALWLYLRLCQVLKYDEGNFYRDYRYNPNDYPYDSLKVAGSITAETPVTCFNFSRIAVKLLNQIKGVHALMIAVGTNSGHFRFGYYTDKVSVDAEPITPQNHYNDIARVKLGIRPQGLVIFNGYETMCELADRIVPPMLAESQQGLHSYLEVLHSLPQASSKNQIKIEDLVEALKQQGIDGATLVQLLFNMNKQFRQPPYQFARTGLFTAFGDVQPQLLVRSGQKLERIALDTLTVSQLPTKTYETMVRRGELIYTDDKSRRKHFEQGLTMLDDDSQIEHGWKIPIGRRLERQQEEKVSVKVPTNQERGKE